RPIEFRENALSGERVERRLAAILAADVAGYSRLMGQDEAGTLARLRTHRRELIDPNIAEHRGRIVKTAGDGLLVEFPSVVEAVACAVAVQRGMARSAHAEPIATRRSRWESANSRDNNVADSLSPTQQILVILSAFRRATSSRLPLSLSFSSA